VTRVEYLLEIRRLLSIGNQLERQHFGTSKERDEWHTRMREFVEDEIRADDRVTLPMTKRGRALFRSTNG